ncbi:MAG: RHS repeat domain-containing protein, partial [Pseudomonadota bacterium]
DRVVLSRVVDDNGWITSSTNARGYTVGYDFNDVGWLTNIDMYGPWSDTSITYSDLSNGPRQIINRGPERTTTDYDAYLRPILERRQAVSAGGGNIYMSYEYDGLGRKIFESWPSLTSLTDDGIETSYDALGRPLTQRENVAPFATTSYQYLSLNRTVMTDPVNSVTTTKYSGYGSPEDGDPIEVTDPLNTKTQMAYDIYGNLKSARQFGSVNGYSVDQTQRWYYDSRYRLCRHSVPETGDTIYNYDTLDRLTRRIPGQTSGPTNCPVLASSPDRIEYDYDDLDRLEFVDFPDATPDITHTYDANGNVTRTQRGATDWTYTYNTLDLPRIERLQIDGRTYQSTHGYNAAGHETSVTFPDGKKTAFHPDAFGRPKRVIDANSPQKTRWADNIAYFANGRISNVSYRNGHALSQMQNARQLVSGIDVRSLGPGAQIAVDLTYDYDAGARITAIDDNVNAGWDRTFGYDAASRLTSATGPWGSGATAADYKYDALGNIRRKQVGARVVAEPA